MEDNSDLKSEVISKFIAEVGSVRQGYPIAYVVSEFQYDLITQEVGLEVAIEEILVVLKDNAFKEFDKCMLLVCNPL